VVVQIPVQDYKYLRIAVVTCDNQVNTQTHTHRERKKLSTGYVQLTQLAELIIRILRDSLTVTENTND